MLTTARAADELIVAVRFPVMTGQGVGFHEIARRHGDFAIIAVAAAVEKDKTIRVGVGGMAGKPMVRKLHGDVADAVGDWAEELEGYQDLHASAALRRDLFRKLGPHVIAQATGGTA
jgi:2-furoyl-CoA dehydrogenase FAD binding subunit